MKITSLADAVSVLDYLNQRGLLCHNCQKPATVTSFAHTRCDACKYKTAHYDPVQVKSEADKHILRSYREWLQACSEGQGDPGGTGKPGNTAGGNPTP